MQTKWSTVARWGTAWMWAALLASGCGDDAPKTDDAGSVDAAADATGATCMGPADCDDGLFCNGEESCVEGRCVAGTPVLCSDGVECTLDTCSDARGRCEHRAVDADGDGYGDGACRDGAGTALGTDCDDADPQRYPGNFEVCDLEGHDEDCDPTTIGETDSDGDGFVDVVCRNTADDGTVTQGDDCDDARRSTNPASVEVCNGLDEDCDGTVDEEAGGETLYEDRDRDGHGNPAVSEIKCRAAVGWSALSDDCDDTNPAKHGAQLELCDGADNDCDGTTDESPQEVDWFRDLDGDGFGAATSGVIRSCAPQVGHSLLGTDCNDESASRNPAAAEACNALDDDCNGLADFVLAVNDWEDDDADGIADIRCTPSGLDCNDRDPASGEASSLEICDGRDNDCDGTIDESAASRVFYRDADGDGYGSATAGAYVGCTSTAGYVAAGGDCDDDDAGRNPATIEACNNEDDDCDGAVDNAEASTMCVLANATSVCALGTCTIRDCASGFEDCDRMRTNGCEIALSSDAANCGSCGNTCTGRFQAASGVCTAGACELACNAGFSDCDGFAGNGCESRTDSDASNCGACGNVCTAGDHAEARCAAGDCTVACLEGFGDCDGNAENGCEVDTRASVDHCGRCGESCDQGNATAMCVSGRCDYDVTMCDVGFGDCDGRRETGCEQRLDTDFYCGSCATNCVSLFGPVSGVGECEAGACVLASCALGRGNCDANPMNGCEADFNNSLTDCGACGAGCGPPGTNASTSCVGGSCQFFGCFAGFGDCNASMDDGCETNFDLPSSCGACANVCGPGGACVKGPPAGGGLTASCDEVQQYTYGARHTCAVRAGGQASDGAPTIGQVICWGDDQKQQLGPNAPGSSSQSTAAVVPLPASTQQPVLTAGANHTCAAIVDASTGPAIYCWGDDGAGQLGDGTAGGSAATPVRVVGLAFSPGGRVVALDAGSNHTCAVIQPTGAPEQEVWCWGQNLSGECGVDPGSASNVPSPHQVLSAVPTGFSDKPLAAGEGFSCVLGFGSFSDVTCWGKNDKLQLGRAGPSTHIPGTTFLPMGPQRIAAGRSHVCAIDSGTNVSCWGSNSNGELGTGAASASEFPGAAPQLGATSALRDLVLGDGFSCSLAEDFAFNLTLRCVGANGNGQLATGTTATPQLTATTVLRSGTPLSVRSYTLRNGGTQQHLCVTDAASGEVYCWGKNDRMQLGDGTTTNRSAPTPAPTLP